MDWIMFLLVAGIAASCFILGITFGAKYDEPKVYEHVKLLNVDLFDASSMNYHIERYENEGYHYCKDASYNNILVFVKEEEEK